MTALGKTMVIFVFLLTLIWAGLVVNTWVTRTNWKAEADKQNKIAKDNYEGAKAISEQSKADRSASDAKLAALQANVERLGQQLVEERTSSGKLYAAYDAKLKADRLSDTAVKELMDDKTQLQNQVDIHSKNLKVMEADLIAQVILTEKNKNEKEGAIRTANSEKQRADLLVTKLQAKEEELAAAKQGGRGNINPLAPEGFRGTVKVVSGNFIEITPGLNAGLKEGTQLTIHRTVGNKNFIGTLTIGKQIDPDRAVGVWTPPFGVNLPKGDDLPKVGDEVVPKTPR